MKPFRLSDQAESDLRQIWEYIGRDNPDAADRQLDRLYERFTLLGKQPLLGQAREDLRPGLRVFPSGSYVILYYPDEPGVQIVGVIHGARDIAGLFRRGERP